MRTTHNIVITFFACLGATGCGGGAKGVVDGYLSQKDCSERAAFILDPAKNKELMLGFYKTRNVKSCVSDHKGIDDDDCDGKTVGEYCTVNVKGISQRYELKKTPEGFKVDFRATYGYGPDTLERMKAQAAAGVAPRIFTVRVAAKIDGSSTKKNQVPILLKEHEGGSLTTALVQKGLPGQDALLSLLLDGKEHRVMIAVGPSETEGEIDAFRLVQEGWQQREDEDAVVPSRPPHLPASLFAPSSSPPTR